MPTIKKRISVTLPKKFYLFLLQIAQRDEMPPSTKAFQLMEKAMEIEEEEYCMRIVEERDTEDAKYISHEQFWKGIHGVSH